MADGGDPMKPTREDAETNKPEYEEDPILGLWGVGREIWQDENADEYIRRLREDWD